MNNLSKIFSGVNGTFCIYGKGRTNLINKISSMVADNKIKDCNYFNPAYNTEPYITDYDLYEMRYINKTKSYIYVSYSDNMECFDPRINYINTNE